MLLAFASLALPVVAGAACTMVQPGSLWNYEGTIAGKHRVRMTLVFGEQEVTGVYYYASSLQDIRLRGRRVDATHLVLDELDAAGRTTARFETTFPVRDPGGRYGDSELQCEVIAGTWRKAGSDSGLPVYLAMEGSTSGSLAHRYGAIGVADDEVVNRGAQRFWKAVKAGDRATVAACLRYPMTVRVDGKPQRLGGPGDLLAVYDGVFTAAFRDSIAQAMPRNLFVRDQGAMLGHGQAWFGASGKVIALNN